VIDHGSLGLLFRKSNFSPATGHEKKEKRFIYIRMFTLLVFCIFSAVTRVLHQDCRKLESVWKRERTAIESDDLKKEVLPWGRRENYCQRAPQNKVERR
jgi:hypothetical protein